MVNFLTLLPKIQCYLAHYLINMNAISELISMLHKILYPLIFVSGILIGCCMSYMHFYDDSEQYSDIVLLEKIFNYSNSTISDENNRCEGKPVKTVGDVVASLLELNTINKVNMLAYGCFNDTCSMSVSACPPWQESECSSRFLKFNIDNRNKIKANTFICFDIP